MDGVIIGSTAWKLQHLWLTDVGDLDILIIPGRIAPTKCDAHIIKDGTSDALIYDYCKKYAKLNHSNYYVAPLELLYVIKRSHIHRIVKHDTDRWIHQVRMLTLLRTQVGSSIDNILFDDLALNARERQLKEIFTLRFDETNLRIGDSKIDFSKAPEEFFKDNVKRKYNHDDLHLEVASALRGTTDLLYTPLIIPGSSELDQSKFELLSRDAQFDLIKEEIIVLGLERNLIPALESNIKIDIGQSLNEIAAHYITLTGNGLYWLRQYCILISCDLLDMKRYETDKINLLAQRLTGITPMLAEARDERTASYPRRYSSSSYEDDSY